MDKWTIGQTLHAITETAFPAKGMYFGKTKSGKIIIRANGRNYVESAENYICNG